MMLINVKINIWVKHYAKYFVYIISQILTATLWSKYFTN